MTKLPSAGAPVLVVSHEASRTGGPRAAIEVVRSLESLGVRRVVILRWPGPLRGQFEAAADQVLLEPLRRARVLLRSRLRGGGPAVALEQLAAAWLLIRHRPRLVYLNTVKSACYIRPALRLGVPVVLHVHELEPLASTGLGRYRLDRLWPRVQLVACSAAVADNLRRITGVAEVTVIPSTVDAELVAVRAGAGPPPAGRAGALVVGACGTADHRKGADVWLEVAREVRERAGRDVRFVWVGAPGMEDLNQRVRRLGLDDAVVFTGDLDNPYPALAAMDVFTHPARQDPFPLAVMEAMALGRPVVAFAIEGVRDQVGDAGVLVPDGDAGAMARAVLDLLGDEDRRAHLGCRARTRATGLYGIAAFRTSINDLVGARLRG